MWEVFVLFFIGLRRLDVENIWLMFDKLVWNYGELFEYLLVCFVNIDSEIVEMVFIFVNL